MTNETSQMNASEQNQKSSEQSLKRNEDLELLIDKKIAEAKLVVAEKRLNYLLAIGAALFAIFGTIIPLFLTEQSSDRVDRSIETMEKKFDELAGKKLRKPEIQCFIDESQLVHSVVRFDHSNKTRNIVIRNVGDGTAEFIKVKLYIQSKTNYFDKNSSDYRTWQEVESDKTHFDMVLLSEGSAFPMDKHFYLAAKDTMTFSLSVKRDLVMPAATIIVDAILVVFYGEPNYLEVPFSFEFGGSY
jgi:hypothetical protein